jgi:hypothetical protein
MFLRTWKKGNLKEVEVMQAPKEVEVMLEVHQEIQVWELVLGILARQLLLETLVCKVWLLQVDRLLLSQLPLRQALKKIYWLQRKPLPKLTRRNQDNRQVGLLQHHPRLVGRNRVLNQKRKKLVDKRQVLNPEGELHKQTVAIEEVLTVAAQEEMLKTLSAPFAWNLWLNL